MTTELSVAGRSLGERLQEVYERLLRAYGPQHWWPGDSAFETIVGAILTQSAAWPNVERALDRMKAADALSATAIVELEPERLAELVRPSGYYNAKARKLKAFCEMVQRDFHGSLEALLDQPPDELRLRLLGTYGIGPETADDIILYAAGRPAFVVDAYTRRIFSRLGITPVADEYETWRSLFMEALPPDSALFNEYHALIVRHAKVSCSSRPRCAGCVLRDLCPSAQFDLQAPAVSG